MCYSAIDIATTNKSPDLFLHGMIIGTHVVCLHSGTTLTAGHHLSFVCGGEHVTHSTARMFGSNLVDVGLRGVYVVVRFEKVAHFVVDDDGPLPARSVRKGVRMMVGQIAVDVDHKDGPAT